MPCQRKIAAAGGGHSGARHAGDRGWELAIGALLSGRWSRATLRPESRWHALPFELRPTKAIHRIFVRESTDERLYREHDVIDALGVDESRFWRWEVGAERAIPAVPVRPLAALAIAEVEELEREVAPPAIFRLPVAASLAQGPAAVAPASIVNVAALLRAASPAHAPVWLAALAGDAAVVRFANATPRELFYPDAMTEALAAFQAGDRYRVRAISVYLSERRDRAAVGGSAGKARRVGLLIAALAALMAA